CRDLPPRCTCRFSSAQQCRLPPYHQYRASPEKPSGAFRMTPSRLIHWAESVGPATAQIVHTILETKPHPEMGYRSCLGILRLAKTYSNERLEAASQRVLQLRACSYQSLRSILKNSLDRQLSLEP